MPSTRRELPWDEIEIEVVNATKLYFNRCDTPSNRFISIKNLSEFLYYENMSCFPHLADVGIKTVSVRCSTAMRRMGWPRYSKKTFVIPDGVI